MTIACCWAWLCGWSTAYGFRASLLDGNRDLSGGGVDGVFDEFLDDGSGSFDDLAGGDLGGAAREVPKFLRWGHGEAWELAQRVSCIEAGNGATQRLWRCVMRLLANNRVRGEFGRTREPSRLRRQLPTHATRSTVQNF